MTTLLRFLRNRFVWSLPDFLGAVAEPSRCGQTLFTVYRWLFIQ
jgi:hypothetical protein